MSRPTPRKTGISAVGAVCVVAGLIWLAGLFFSIRILQDFGARYKQLNVNVQRQAGLFLKRHGQDVENFDDDAAIKNALLKVIDQNPEAMQQVKMMNRSNATHLSQLLLDLEAGNYGWTSIFTLSSPRNTIMTIGLDGTLSTVLAGGVCAGCLLMLGIFLCIRLALSK